MKNKNFLKKIAAVTLGFVMTLGVGAAGYAGAVNETKGVATNPIVFNFGSNTDTNLTCGNKTAAQMEAVFAAPEGLSWGAGTSVGISSGKLIKVATNSGSGNITLNLTVANSYISDVSVGYDNSKGGYQIKVDGVAVSSFTEDLDATTITIHKSGSKALYLSSVSITYTTKSSGSSYTVTFDANGHGTAPAAATVNAGSTVSKPTDPTADGYLFGGWYTEEACTNEYNFSSTVNSSFTLYAKWTAQSADKYTLVCTQNGSNTDYSAYYNIEYNNISWNVPGNHNFANYWRIGGKSISGVDRIFESKDKIPNNIGKITIAHDGIAGSSGYVFTLNSVTFKASSTGDFSGTLLENKTVTPTINGSGNIIIEIDNIASSYVQVIFNCTETGGKNGGLGVKSISFEPGVSKTLTSIAVKTAPSTITYTAGQNFNAAGLVITATYDVGDPVDIPYAGNESLFTFNPSTNLAQGTTSVTITYGGKTTTQAITVSAAKTLSSIAIGGSLTNTTYYNGVTTWKTDGLTVTATYSDASTANVTSSSTFVFKQNGTTCSSPTAGSVSIYASYQTITSQNSVSATISILGSENNPMTVAQAMTYIDSEEYRNSNNMYVIGTISQVDSYNSTYKSIQYWISDDGSTTSQLECYSGKGLNNTDFSSKDDLETGITVTVVGFLKKYYDTYEFDKNNYIVSWNKKAVESISIKTSQTQTAYNVGDTFVAAGLVITVYYDNNTSEDIAYNDHSSDFSFSSVSNQGKVTITYKNDKSCEQTVTLLVIANITGVASHPTTVERNSTISPSSVVLNATYNTGTATTVTPDSVTCDTTKFGIVTATATYSAATGTKTATFQIEVVNAAQTQTITISEIADQEKWTTSGNVYGQTEFTFGDFKIVGSGTGNNCKYYTGTPETWRFYSSGNGQIVLSTTNGAKFKSVSISVTEGSTSFVLSNNDTVATSTGFSATTKISSFIIEYYPAILVEKISLTDGTTTITSNDESPAYALTEETTFTASYEPIQSGETLTWTLKSASNLSMSGSGSSRTISIGDLKLDGSATLEVKSKNITLSVALTYTHPGKVNKSISIPAGQEYKNAYAVGETLNLSGLTAVIKYTSSIYDDLDVNYNDDPSKFSVTYKYEGYETEYPSTKAFELPDGVEKLDARLTITYTDTYGSVSVRTQVVHVTADIEPVTKLTINNLSHNLDVYDHKTIQMTCEVEPASATDKSVTWESLNEDVATIDENGNVTVVTDTAQSFTIRCTTNGKDENGQPLVKEKTIAIKEHNSISFVYADENGSEITNLDHFEYGKIYTITAIDNNFPDEDEDFTWEKYNGKSSFEFVDNVTTGKTVQIRITAVSGTTAIRLKALIHGKNAITKDGIPSAYQPVSSVEISADKTILYTNDTAEITLAVNQYSAISEDIDISVSDENVATVTQNDGANNKFTLTPHKHGNVTVTISVDGVASNTLAFKIVEMLNPIDAEISTEKQVTFTKSDFYSSGTKIDQCTRDGVTVTLTSNNCGSSGGIKILGTGGSPKGKISIDAGSNIIVSMKGTGTTSKFTNFDTDNINASTFEKANPNSSQWELTTIVITYLDVLKGDVANTNISVQNKVLEYAEQFNSYKTIDSSTWATLKVQFETMINSFETDEEKELARAMFKYASTSGSSLDTLQQCVKKYDRAYATLGLGDDANFMDRTKIDISATISAEVGFQFTGLDVTKFEFIFTGDYTATDVTEYGFLISTNPDTLNSCINEKNTSGTGIISFVCEDDEAECVAGVKLEKTSITYYVTFYYIDGSGKHYSEVLEISVDGYLTSDDFNIEDITDPYAKIAIQVYIASLEK